MLSERPIAQDVGALRGGSSIGHRRPEDGRQLAELRAHAP